MFGIKQLRHFGRVIYQDQVRQILHVTFTDDLDGKDEFERQQIKIGVVNTNV